MKARYCFRLSLIVHIGAEITAESVPRRIRFKGSSKAGYTLIVSRVSTCLCTILWDCEPITIHFSQCNRFRSFLILRETCRIILFDVSWKYQLPGENGETWDEKNYWRDGLQNAIYTLLIYLFSRSRQFDNTRIFVGLFQIFWRKIEEIVMKFCRLRIY